MTGTDQIYTPSAVAAALVAAATRTPATVADFAAGEGALLSASAERWPTAHHMALDIDPDAVVGLGRRHPGWETHTRDFLRDADQLLDHRGRVDLVLLNPPFSCRGNTRLRVTLGGIELTCSRAMAFICTALPFLSAQGELIAIVPASCLSNVKDAAVRAAIGEHFAVTVLNPTQASVFHGCAVAVAQIRISRNLDEPNAWAPPPPTAEVRRLHAAYKVRLARGSVSVHEVQTAAGRPFVHTTDLKAGGYQPSGRRHPRSEDVDAGQAAVLLPRVGRPDLGKLVLAEGPLVLSDCLFRLQTEPPGHEAELQQLLAQAWDRLSGVYGGSCAPYATLAGLKAFLTSIGLEVDLIPMRRLPKPPSVAALIPVERRARRAARP